MAAWREVARRIAHEVKNPLTPISLSAQRLKRKYASQIDDPVFDECTRMIIDHVDLIRNLVNEFSAFARFPTADLATCDLPPIIEETVALYKEGHELMQFETLIEGDLPIPQMHLDRQQIKQAMINLVDNAIAAVKGKGHVEIKLVYYHTWDFLRIEVCDDGPGISDAVKSRLFEPNFSTKKARHRTRIDNREHHRRRPPGHHQRGRPKTARSAVYHRTAGSVKTLGSGRLISPS